jgi:hypothetical protein
LQDIAVLLPEIPVFSRALIRIFVVVFAFSALCLAQEETPSLGDLARQERERRAAAKTNIGPELGAPTPPALMGELIPAHFLRFEGDVGDSEYVVLINGKTVLKDTHVRGLPIYVTPYLLDGGNLLGIQFVSHPTEPIDIVIEERFAGETEHREVARYHADANQYQTVATKQIPFTAHPRAVPDIQLTDSDRIAIYKLLKAFYDAAANKDGAAILKLFEPGITDAREIYPEGADFGENEMTNLAHIVGLPDFAMEYYNPVGLTLSVTGNVVMVKRGDGSPVFASNKVAGDSESNAGPSRLSADVIPLKKINDVWRLTLPFGF